MDNQYLIPRASLLKQPRQERSIAMVHAICDAAILVLTKEGVGRFSANRVATVAGVSPGTVYQYFANKEMILAAVVERGILDVDAQIQTALRMSTEVPIGPFCRQVIQALLVSLLPHRDLLAEVLTATPVLSRSGIAVVLENRFADVVREYLAINGHRYRLEGGTASVYVTVNAGIYTGLKWLADDPPHVSLGDLVERLGQLVEQLVAPA